MNELMPKKCHFPWIWKHNLHIVFKCNFRISWPKWSMMKMSNFDPPVRTRVWGHWRWSPWRCPLPTAGMNFSMSMSMIWHRCCCCCCCCCYWRCWTHRTRRCRRAIFLCIRGPVRGEMTMTLSPGALHHRREPGVLWGTPEAPCSKRSHIHPIRPREWIRQDILQNCTTILTAVKSKLKGFLNLN